MKRAELIFHTRKGTLYNLTPINQKFLEIDSVQLVIADFYDMMKVYEKFPETLNPKKFMNLQGKKVYMSSIDPWTRRTRAISDPLGTELFHFGFKKFSHTQYLEFFQKIQPETLVIMGEEKNNTEGKGSKAMKRTINKAMKFLYDTLECVKSENFTGNPDSKIFAPVYGDDDLFMRKLSLRLMEKYLGSIHGLTIYGLFKGESYRFRRQFYSMLDEYLVKNDSKRFDLVLSSVGKPMAIIEGWLNGVNQFEVQYPFLLAEKGISLDFDVADWVTKSKTLSNTTDADYLADLQIFKSTFDSDQSYRYPDGDTHKNDKISHADAQAQCPQTKMLDSLFNGDLEVCTSVLADEKYMGYFFFH